jgi:hypothetical protein
MRYLATVGVQNCMQLRKTLILVGLAIGACLVQMWLIIQTPWTILINQFPYSALTSGAQPTLIALLAAIAAIFTNSTIERRLFLYIFVGSILEIAILDFLPWQTYRFLIFSLPILNSFIIFQFLRYGLILITVQNNDE